MNDRSYVWYVILLLAVVNVFNYMDRMALSVLMPHIKVDLHLSDAQLGLLVGFAFSLFYAVCAIPIARWADRGIRRNIIAIALATWSVMTALSGAAQNFWHLLIARVGVGAGEAGSMPPAQSMICDYVPLERRAGVFAILGFGLMAGMMLGMTLAGLLGETIGWRWTFVVLGLPGVAVAIVVRLTLREPVRGALDKPTHDSGAVSLRKTLEMLWRCKTYVLITLSSIVIGFVQYGILQWWPSFYARVFGLDLPTVGVHLGVAIGVGSAAGLLIGGLLANRAARRDVRLPLVLAATGICLALPAILAALFVESAAASMSFVALSQVCFGAAHSPLVATLYGVVAPRIRATAGSINLFFQSAVGFSLGPFCVGLLSDFLLPSRGPQGLRYALLAPLCLIPVLVIVIAMATRTVKNDLEMT